MTYITVKEASEKWNITERRVCILCSKGRIPGALKKSKVWMIPENAKKPEDGRRVATSYEMEPAVLLLQPTYFENNAGYVDCEVGKKICEIQREYLEGNLEKAYTDLCSLMERPEYRRYYILMLVIRITIAAALGKQRDYIAKYLEVDELCSGGDCSEVEKMLYRYVKGQPDALGKDLLTGEHFEEIAPIISLFSVRRSLNEGFRRSAAAEITNLEIICKDLESKNSPLICAYYHIYLAFFYNIRSMVDQYEYHIKRAANILKDRGWISPLTEYSATLDYTCICDMDPEFYQKVMQQKELIMANYLKVGIFDGIENRPRMDMSLNYKIGYKIILGKSNEEIADELGMSKYRVKQHIEDLCMIAGVSSRKEVKDFIAKKFQL